MSLSALLEQTKQQTLSYYELPEEALHKTYGEGKWNIRQILVHLADAESVLYGRIRRVISEPRQVIWAFQQDAWAENLQYEQYPLALSKNVYAAVRDNIIYLTEKYYLSHGTKEFVHSETGVRTLKDEFDKVAHHNLNHLRQIEVALKRA
ncbi:DinB family protein [Catalinimonas niigatensis]|uniref:DinB family protein n=1 Tax=Catalinimonas niigatensis TaxID=1397264 RepID=UPI00266716CB|nr:DinB family protein [Catalinimonas niigatensis]WPP52671.1 DinB family protein [Catalinimonas niigatensis]